MFQKKQELNFFVQKILKISYGKEDPFKALIFVASVPTDEEEQPMDLVKSLRTDLKSNMKKVRSDFKTGQ